MKTLRICDIICFIESYIIGCIDMLCMILFVFAVLYEELYYMAVFGIASIIATVLFICLEKLQNRISKAKIRVEDED